MQLQRNEIMTGLLVIGTIAVVAFLLVLLGAPGLFLVAGVLFSVERLPQLRIAAKPRGSRPADFKNIFSENNG
jgi:hypothetical protein